MFAFTSRLPFIAGVALVAAALGDAVVETVSNSGLLGPGFADDNHSSVIPALIAGCLLALELARARSVQMVRAATAGRRPDWLVDLARRCADGSPCRDLPFAFGAQLLALFAMESAEQLAVGGKLAGGTAWLGGPVLFSLLVHALIGAGCTFALAWLVRAVLSTVAALVRGALDFILIELARAAAHVRSGRRDEPARCGARAALARQAGDRAPPQRPFALA